MIRDRRNLGAGLLFILFGGGVALGGLQYDLGTTSRMGPGYFPVAVGAILAFLGLAVLVGAFFKGAATTHVGEWPWRVIVIVLGSVSVFGLLVPHLGLLLTATLLILLSGMAHRRQTWRGSLLSAALLAPASAAIFVGLLGLRIPLLPTLLAF